MTSHSADDDNDEKPVNTKAQFTLFDDLKKKVDLSQDAESSLNEYRAVRAVENPYQI